MNQSKHPHKKYKQLTRQLRRACKYLKWEFSLWTDVINRCSIDDGVAFTIDKVEYFVSTIDDKEYYAAVMVQYHGSRDEPPSEDEQVLKGPNVTHPESLVIRILDAHWQVRRQWTMEALAPEEQG